MPYKNPNDKKARHNKYMREVWYPANRAKHQTWVNDWRDQRRAERKKELYELKKMGCPCGEKDIACLDFHHPNPKAKEFTVASMLDVSANRWPKVLEEAQKCAVLCSNCHRKHHFHSQPSPVTAPVS